MADPVAEKSGFLKMYMSHHPDTLVAYCRFYGGITEPITGAEMTAIDCNGMTLTYTKKKDGSQDTVVVPIQPPLNGYDDVKPRLLEMKAKAQEGLGMIKAPQLPNYEFPTAALRTTVPMVLFLLYCTTANTTDAPAFLPGLYTPGRMIVNAVGGKTTLKAAWWFAGVIHSLETLYTVSLCRKHTNFVVGSLYAVTTFVIGFPTFVQLRKRIQAARIDSVMKIE